MIYWLDGDVDGSTAESLAALALGGKAVSLVRLLAQGLPVPPGFVILPAAFGRPAGVMDAAVPVIPEAVPHIQDAYRELARRVGQESPVVAVRSSASAEDLPGASFAGQYNTYLGIRGADDVVRYAAHCVASLYSAHALAYRRQVELSGETLPAAAMAVIVQLLINADVAGVAFTADPVSGDRHQVIVNASWGLGESIVDGVVEGDTWHVDRESLVIAQEIIGMKATRTGASPDAPREVVPESSQREACLEPERVQAVAQLALRAERVVAHPADVEWALCGGQLYALQARAITTLHATALDSPGFVATSGTPHPDGALAADGVPGAGGRPGAAEDAGAGAAAAPAEGPRGPSAVFPFEWPQAELAAFNWKLEGGTVPARPWEIDERSASVTARRHAAELLGGDTHRQVVFINGFRYGRDEPVPGGPAERHGRRTAFERPAEAMHRRGLTYWETVLFPEIDEGNQRLRDAALDELESAALAAHLGEALRWYERLWTLHGYALRTLRGQPGTLRAQLATLYQEITGDSSADATAPLIAYVSNKLSDAIDGLIQLARVVQQYPSLRQLFETEIETAILERLGEVEGGAAFQEQLGQVLETQGLRSDAGAFTVRQGIQPGWAERPFLVIALVKRYVPKNLDILAQAREAAVAERDAQTAALRETITDEATRQRLDALLDGARGEARAYEDHNYHIDCAAGALLYRALMAAGRRLTAQGVLSAPEDVWWLRHQEIAGILSASSPDGSGPRWDLLIQSRNTLHEWQRSLTPPDWLGAPPPPTGAAPNAGPVPTGGAPASTTTPAATAAVGPEAPPTVLLRGMPGSRGIATGRVRLVPRDALVPDVEPGDILVAYNAGVLWTPVFPVAGAVILDEGVLFQHAMLTCREYGVPGIFQSKRGTSVLQDGQRVTVDGTHGWVLPAEAE